MVDGGQCLSDVAHSCAYSNITRLPQLYVTPVALTTSIFSMQTNFLPLVQPTFAWFVGLILIFSLMGLGVLCVQPILFFYCQSATNSCWSFCNPRTDGPVVRRKKKFVDDVETAVTLCRSTTLEGHSRQTAMQSVRMATFGSVTTVVPENPHLTVAIPPQACRHPSRQDTIGQAP